MNVLLDIAIKILDLCIYPFRMVGSSIVLIPFAFLVVLGVVGIVISLIKGGR